VGVPSCKVHLSNLVEESDSELRKRGQRRQNWEKMKRSYKTYSALVGPYDQGRESLDGKRRTGHSRTTGGPLPDDRGVDAKNGREGEPQMIHNSGGCLVKKG